MQLPKHGQVTDAGKSPRMVVLRSVVSGQPDRTVETLQQFFNVALKVEEIEFPGGLMDRRQPQVATRPKDQCSPFAPIPVDLAQLVHLEIPNAAVEIPLQRVQQSWNQG